MPSPRDPEVTTRILQAARALHDETPDWTMSSLAIEANVSRSALYRRFSTREEVVAALDSDDGAGRFSAEPSIRERALDAVATVALRQGLAASTIEDVAAEANVGVATIYRYFGSREGLLTAFADARTPRAELGQLSLEQDVPLREALHRVTLAMLRHLTAEGPLLLLGLSPDPETQRVLGHLRTLESDARRQFAAYLAPHVDAGRLRGEPMVLTNAFVGLVAGSVLLEPTSIQNPEAVARQLVTLFLEGCEVQP